MIIQERLQAAIHQLEVGFGGRIIRWLLIGLVPLAMTVLYDTRAYHNFNSPEAMDAAQLARNLSEGRGYTTEFIRPFSLYLMQKHHRALHPEELTSTNFIDAAQIYTAHPDLANAPLYPLVLAGLMKTLTPQWKLELHKPFWSDSGNFRRYQPEFQIAIMNQILLIAVVLLTFAVARKLFDSPAAWLSMLLMLGSNLLWKFSASGLSTMLLLAVFLGLIRCLIQTEELGRVEQPNTPRLFILAVVAGLLTGLGMLTRYSFGWLIVPVIVFLLLFGGKRRTGQAVTAFLSFVLVVTPWIGRNFSVSGTFFGTAGYAVVEGTSWFPGTKLMQSVNPDEYLYTAWSHWLPLFSKKFLENISYLFQGDLFRLAGGWVAVLFFSGLLLGLRNSGARRLRYFTIMCLGVFMIVTALGRTQLSNINGEMNSENLFILLTPLVTIFGVAFFLTLVNQMNVPSPQARFGVISLLVALSCQPLISTLLPPNPDPMAYPPYSPPDIQKIAGWMRPDELMMSDVPWAVAWYGDRQCTWTTINSQYEFYLVNDYIKPVHALYLTLDTLNGKLFTECLQGGVNSWGYFGLYAVAANQLPSGFPLRNFPLETVGSGLYLTDRQRW